MEKPLLLAESPLTEQDWQYYLAFEPYAYVENIRAGLKRDNRFFVDVRFRKLLFWLLKDGMSHYYTQKILEPTKVIAGNILYRARLYKAGDKINQEPEFHGYDKAGSFVPPDSCLLLDGRISPSGIKYLYTASDIKTAIAEVNPHINNQVSVAKIIIKSSLHIFNMAIRDCGIDVKDCPAASDWLQKFVLCLSGAFEQPYENSGDYFLCQYVSEYVKLWGFDGICHYSSKVIRSANCAGINFVIFNYNKCEPVSSEMYFVGDIDIKFY